MTPSAAAALAGVPVAKSGVGSAVLNSCRQVGGSLGIAVIGAIIANEAGASRTPEAFVHGFSTALDVAALIGDARACPAAPRDQRRRGDQRVRRMTFSRQGRQLRPPTSGCLPSASW